MKQNIKSELTLFPDEVKTEFHNTIDVEGEDLEKRTGDAKLQRERVLDLFMKNPNLKFTPFEVHKKLGFKENKTPVSSIRRAITNMTKKDGTGILVKMKEKKMERLGAPNFLWMLNHDYLPM